MFIAGLVHDSVGTMILDRLLIIKLKIIHNCLKILRESSQWCTPNGLKEL